MTGSSNAMEALRLISDWNKWIVTIETFAIALLGSLFASGKIAVSMLAKTLGTAAIACFVFSIAAAAMLLATLPEIAQNLHPDVNIPPSLVPCVFLDFGLDGGGGQPTA